MINEWNGKIYFSPSKNNNYLEAEKECNKYNSQVATFQKSNNDDEFVVKDKHFRKVWLACFYQKCPV